MNCPKNITEPWRRELWDDWYNRLLGETITDLAGNKFKVNYRRINETVRKAEGKENTLAELLRRMTK
jgi:hypothetical protein